MSNSKHVRHLMGTSRYMDQIRMSFQLMCKINAKLNMISAIIYFITNDPYLDRKITAADLMDPVDDRISQTCSVFYTSAPFIFTSVLFRKELRDQPAVTAMDCDHIKAAGLTVQRCSGMLFNDFHDLIFIHHFDRRPISRDTVYWTVKIIT